MTARGTPSRFLQSVLHNGVGRYVCQLKRISIAFSKKGQGSLGVRYVLSCIMTNCIMHLNYYNKITYFYLTFALFYLLHYFVCLFLNVKYLFL